MTGVKCLNCRWDVPDGSRFCPGCGALMNATQSDPAIDPDATSVIGGAETPSGQFASDPIAPGESQFLEGTLLAGRYRVVARLGKGGMGEVFRATDVTLYREVAIKKLSSSLALDSEHLARFRREAQVLASLNHPNIATIYSFEESRSFSCLVMELVPGYTLSERIRTGPVPCNESLEICAQVAEALASAHKSGITHRDIKPSNIKVTPEGRVKVLDFGLAKSFSREDQQETLTESAARVALTKPGMILGTPAYMSPEQIRCEAADNRSDIWAFGCVMFELLSGRQPFPGTNVAELIAAVLKNEPEWRALPATTPAKAAELIRQCLQKDPLRRLQDVAEARAAIESVLRDGTSATLAELRPIGRSLAVLPFANVSRDPEMEYLSDGLTEHIISSLSQVPQLRVTARSAVFRHKGLNEEPQQAGRALGVETVVAGKVLQKGETLLIGVELMDVEGGWQLWGAQYRRKTGDIFEIEEDIAKEIASNLRLKLAPEKEKLMSRRYTENAEAYRCYLKGKFYWSKRTEEGLYKSIEYFRQAIELDPTYALAYAGIAEAYRPLSFYCHIAPKDAAAKSMAAANAALGIDPDIAEARAVIGAVKAFSDWDVLGGEDETRAAIELDAKYSRARQVLAEILTVMGRFAEAENESQRALEIDPLALSLNASMSMTCFYLRKYEKAIDFARRAIDMDASFFPAHFFLGLAQQQNGEFSAAATSMEQAKKFSNNSTITVAAHAGILAAWGKDAEARRILGELEEVANSKYVSQVFVASAYGGLGDRGSALSCLEAAYEDRCTWLARVIRDPRFDGLRNEARFHALIEKMGLRRFVREGASGS